MDNVSNEQGFRDEESLDVEMTRKLAKRLAGVQIVFLGTSSTEWTEPKTGEHCPHCDDGKSLERNGHAICVACTRATKWIQRAIDATLKEQDQKVRFVRDFRLSRLKFKAKTKGKGRGNHGARPGLGAERAFAALQARVR